MEQYAVTLSTNSYRASVAWLASTIGYEQPPLPVENITEIRALLEREALRNNLNPALARAVAHIESRGSEFAVSSAGAIGVMQVMPFNTRRCKLKHYGQLFDSKLNIACGVRILAEEMRTYKDDTHKALQAYNGGAKCVGKCSESIQYAKDVVAVMSRDISQ